VLAELDTVTIEAALAWATLPAHASCTWWGQRLTVVRGFARHLKASDPLVAAFGADKTIVDESAARAAVTEVTTE
jgi:hypothetical protein